MFISIIPYRTTGAAWVTILEVGPLSGHDSNHVADIQRVYWRQLARRQRYNVWWCCIVLVLFSKRVKWNQMGFALLVLTTAVLKWRVFKIDFSLHRINFSRCSFHSARRDQRDQTWSSRATVQICRRAGCTYQHTISENRISVFLHRAMPNHTKAYILHHRWTKLSMSSCMLLSSCAIQKISLDWAASFQKAFSSPAPQVWCGMVLYNCFSTQNNKVQVSYRFHLITDTFQVITQSIMKL